MVETVTYSDLIFRGRDAVSIGRSGTPGGSEKPQQLGASVGLASTHSRTLRLKVEVHRIYLRARDGPPSIGSAEGIRVSH